MAKCEAVLNGNNYSDTAKVVLGISKFRLFQREQFNLHANKSLPLSPEWRQNKKVCYKKAEECIKVLGASLDKVGYLDALPSQILDMAMADYSRETNTLHELRRCMLCRKKGKLHRSHLFPRSIVEDICKAVTFLTNKKDLIILPANKDDLFSYQSGPSRAPKELTTYLFCTECEKAFSDQGEMHFPLLFKQIYEEKRPFSIALEQYIEYGEWLYQFCVGLIFRSLCERLEGGYINEESLYELFTQCRQCILDPSYSLTATKEERPLIAMVLNPTTAEREETVHGFMNYALTAALGSYYLSITPLDSLVRDQLLCLHVVIVSFGIFNVIAVVKRENARHLSNECIIHPGGGVFHVLEDKQRRKVIPRGLWAYLCEMAEMHERRYAENLTSEEKQLNFRDPVPGKASTYKIEEGFWSDIEGFNHSGVSSSLTDHAKVINYLPEGYTIDLSGQSAIVLPRGHRMIIHFNTHLPSGVDITIFLAVEDNLLYPESKPYIFFYVYSEGIQINGGFYINSDTAAGGEYLKKKSKEKFVYDMPRAVREIHSSIHEVLPMLLKLKGISSLKSLLCFAQKRYVS